MLKSSTKKDVTVVLPLVVIAAIIASYWPILEKLNFRWSSGDNSYCYLVVPLFLYLCWEKKDSFRFAEINWWMGGVLPALLSVMTIVVGELGSVETLLYIGLWGCVVSLIITLYGWRRSRRLFFPLLILLFIVPMPPYINNMLTFKMKMAASTLSVEMLRVMGISVLQNGNILDLGVTKLQVVDACSGLRYIVSLFMMALLIGHFFVVGLWRKFFLVLLVYPLSIFINAMRIFITAVLILNGFRGVTEGAMHDGAGLLAFLIAGAILFFAGKLLLRVGTVRTPPVARDQGCAPRSTGLALKVTLFYCLLFAGSGWALQNMATAMQIPQRTSFASFPTQIAGWQGTRRYLDQKILDSLWADDYVNIVFSRKGQANRVYLLIPYYEYQGTRHTAHAPRACILGGGWDLVSQGTRRIAVGAGKEIDVGLTIYKKGDVWMLASYFFLQRGRIIISPWWNKFYLMKDAFSRQRTDGALVRVEMTVLPYQALGAAEEQLTDFITGLWPVLSEYVPD